MRRVDKTPGQSAGSPAGGPDKRIVYAVMGIAVVILAAVLIAKAGYNTDLLDPSGGQMSLVRNSLVTVRPTASYAVIRTTIPKRGDICMNGRIGCNGTCVDATTDNNNCGTCGTVCPAGTTCTGGQCQCLSGQTLCGGKCVNTNQDLNNCGACGTICPTSGGTGLPRNCVSGACSLGCTTGETWCGGTDCIHTQTDPANCGHCGTVCPAGKICRASVCQTG
jgi:hypothetical protein